VYEEFNAIVILPPFIVITGGILSAGAGFTITVLVAVEVFPDKSLAEYTTEYVPAIDVSTLFEVVVAVIAPSTISNAVAPAST